MKLFELWGSILPTIADYAGIAGLVISCITLLNMKKIKTALVTHAEKVDFEENVTAIVSDMTSLAESIQQDNLYNQGILDEILGKLDTLEIYYPSSVAKVKKDISKLRKEVNQAIEKLSAQPQYNKRQVAHSLSVLSKKLDKLAKEAKAQ